MGLLVLLAVVAFVVPLVSLTMGVVAWRRLASVTDDIQALSTRIDSLERRHVAPAPPAPMRPRAAATPAPEQPAAVSRPPAVQRMAPPSSPAPLRAPAPPPLRAPAPPPAPSSLDSGVRGQLAAWLFGGNAVVRVGIIVLFFGVAFFLNYAIEQGWLPVEVRLGLAAAAGLGLTMAGWRLRVSRADYALPLQGGGVGIVYLTVFAAVNLYNLIAAGPGLALMVALVGLSSALALLQDARSLAVLAALGGFLAPVLVSSGSGHVALFSYYAALDVGILAIAWFKAWHLLNRLGFVCTFIIGGIWGARYYQPAYFASTEPFLVAFFLFYVGVPVLHARQQRTAGDGAIDGSLLFGVPLIAFGLQAALVRDFEHGLAFSALAAGIFYIALAWLLWSRLRGAARALVEIFLALGVACGTLAIPLAFDSHWTVASWALEGVGLIWVGIRQHRQLARAAGIALQVAAGLSFLATDHPTGGVPVFNSVYVGALTVSLAGLFSAWALDRHRANLQQWEVEGSVALLAWGLLWWCGAGVSDISAHAPSADHNHAYLLFAAGSAMALTLLRRRLAWRHLSVPVLLLLPAMAVIAIRLFDEAPHAFARWGSAAWAMALMTHYWMQRRLESEWPALLCRSWHQGMLWLVVFLASWEATWLTERLFTEPSAWHHVAWALIPSAALVAVPPLTRRSRWPFPAFTDAYLGALVPIAMFLGLWLLATSAVRGNPAPLSYVALANPLELTQCLTLMVLLRWTSAPRTGISEHTRWSVWSILAFAVLNGMIARAMHFHAGVDFRISALWSSAPYQTAVSIVWTLAAFVTMVSATRLKLRAAWLAGAALLGAVVAKLFFVDLDDVGTVARIVSFIGVGLLMLLVGYLSPLPPRAQEHCHVAVSRRSASDQTEGSSAGRPR